MRTLLIEDEPTSRATASVTSLMLRLWLVSCATSSLSPTNSVCPAFVRRLQSTTAIRVLSPGARAAECNRCPSVTPCMNRTG